jgi:hypothetical protein
MDQSAKLLLRFQLVCKNEKTKQKKQSSDLNNRYGGYLLGVPIIEHISIRYWRGIKGSREKQRPDFPRFAIGCHICKATIKAVEEIDNDERPTCRQHRGGHL